jgi:hypothetical protein
VAWRTFFFAALSASEAACALVVANGFSQSTCFPASIASDAMSKWRAFGVQMWTASIAGSASTAR